MSCHRSVLPSASRWLGYTLTLTNTAESQGWGRAGVLALLLQECSIEYFCTYIPFVNLAHARDERKHPYKAIALS